MTEDELATLLRSTLDGAAAWDRVSRRRLAHRIAHIDSDADREVHQFRALQQAARESAPLGKAFDAAGLPGLADLDTRRVAPTTGALVQAFNRLVESGWSAQGGDRPVAGYSGPRRRMN